MCFSFDEVIVDIIILKVELQENINFPSRKTKSQIYIESRKRSKIREAKRKENHLRRKSTFGSIGIKFQFSIILHCYTRVLYGKKKKERYR